MTYLLFQENSFSNICISKVAILKNPFQGQVATSTVLKCHFRTVEGDELPVLSPSTVRERHFRTVDGDELPVRSISRIFLLCIFLIPFNFFNFLLILRHTRVLRGSVCLSYFLMSSDINKYCVHTLSRGSRI